MKRLLCSVLAVLSLGLSGWLGAGCSGGNSSTTAAVADVPAQTNWLTDLPQALVQAKAEHKLVLLDFTGSDWCEPCIQLNRKVFATEKFKAYADTNLVLVLVDFPAKKSQPDDLQKANKALQEKFDAVGYPNIVLLDADGKLLSKQRGYGGEGVEEFLTQLDKSREGIKSQAGQTNNAGPG